MLSAAPKPFLSVDEAGELLHRHPATIRRWVRNGQLPGVRIGGRSLYIPMAGLLAMHYLPTAPGAGVSTNGNVKYTVYSDI